MTTLGKLSAHLIQSHLKVNSNFTSNSPHCALNTNRFLCRTVANVFYQSSAEHYC